MRLVVESARKSARVIESQSLFKGSSARNLQKNGDKDCWILLDIAGYCGFQIFLKTIHCLKNIRAKVLMISHPISAVRIQILTVCERVSTNQLCLKIDVSFS